MDRIVNPARALGLCSRDWPGALRDLPWKLALKRERGTPRLRRDKAATAGSCLSTMRGGSTSIGA